MKKIVAILSCVSMIGLSACSHANPLKDHSTEETVKFLKEASKYASQKLNYEKNFPEDVYGKCILKNINEYEGFCQKLYDYMVEYAEKNNPDFSSINVSDLENKEYFETIKRKYFLYGMGTITINGKEV